MKQFKGGPGVDGMTVGELPAYLVAHCEAIREQLLAGVYQPQPVRRAEIPKPGEERGNSESRRCWTGSSNSACWMIFRAFVLCAILSSSLTLADSELDRLGTTGISGGVTHASVKDQKSGEICWSYTLTAVAEASYRRDAIDQAVCQSFPHGTPVQLAVARARLAKDLRHYTTHVSPEYLRIDEMKRLTAAGRWYPCARSTGVVPSGLCRTQGGQPENMLASTCT